MLSSTSCLTNRPERAILLSLLALWFIAAPGTQSMAMPVSRFAPLAAPALTETVLESFGDPVRTGASPTGGLIQGAKGVLYGTTFYGGTNNDGTVFALTPPPAGMAHWTETILHSFSGTNTSNPASGVIADANGALYGEVGSAIFKLTPPSGDRAGWTYSVIYQFTAIAGSGGLIFDESGDLYGVTETGPTGTGAGTVFELTPPAAGKSTWTEKTLYAFSGGADGRFPVSPLVRDATGALYGTTYQGGGSPNCKPAGRVGCGVVFRLNPPAAGQTAWTESVLRAFNGTDGEDPNGRLLLMGGAVYGANGEAAGSSTGNIFKLTPPSSGNGPWNETILYTFPSTAGPEGGLVVDRNGDFFGVTIFGGNQSCSLGCGIVFELSPPVAPQTHWKETTLFRFSDGSSGHYPSGSLLPADGVFYDMTDFGGASGNGTVFELR